jgi:subtilisin family serine protease|tara:strand:+ start:4271 stop:5854 length:1584 start_codon:yes stop_codon:yes gene_type:complete
MSEKEYTVVVHKGIDLSEIEAEITASSGAGPIPNRSVDIANPRPGSKRQTHFMLTDEEATALEADTRVLAVEIPPDQRTDIQIGFNSTQLGNFTKPITFTDNTLVNWGLRRSIMETNGYGSGGTSDNTFPYALTGKGVDIVIQDSGIEPNHPDFIDSNGVSRVKAIDWYAAQSVVSGTQNANYNRDFDGHGTLCASITAGNVYGFAKDAHIYSMKISGLEGSGDAGTGTPISDCFDVIKEWHNAKTNSRPTVVNMSWGYSTSQAGNPTGGIYRGSSWIWGTDYSTDLEVWQNVGVVVPLGSGARGIPIRVSSVDADVDELIAAGVHVAIASGNDYYKGDVDGGDDYDNLLNINGLSIQYHRGSSPHSDNAFIVGNIDKFVYNDNGIYKDRTAGSSSRGPRVNMWAPGQNIVGAVSTTNVYTSLDSPVDANFKIVSLSGTSFAAPQVAGVTALHLQVNPQSTPLQLKTKLLAEAKPVMYDTASNTDYTQFNTSLLGASTKVLFDKYGRQPVEISGQNLTLQRATPTTT